MSPGWTLTDTSEVNGTGSMCMDCIWAPLTHALFSTSSDLVELEIWYSSYLNLWIDAMFWGIKRKFFMRPAGPWVGLPHVLPQSHLSTSLTRSLWSGRTDLISVPQQPGFFLLAQPLPMGFPPFGLLLPPPCLVSYFFLYSQFNCKLLWNILPPSQADTPTTCTLSTLWPLALIAASVHIYMSFSLVNVSFPSYTVSFIRTGLSQCLGFFLFLFCVPKCLAHCMC